MHKLDAPAMLYLLSCAWGSVAGKLACIAARLLLMTRLHDCDAAYDTLLVA